MSRASRLNLLRLVVSVALVGSSTFARAATLFDPALRFRVLPTEHFLVYFHQGEEELAGRLARIAEEAWQKLTQPLGVMPPRLTHVVLVDQTELANGFATPFPYDTIVVSAVWPAGSEFLGNVDDWLRLVFTHEFTHIVHLDRSEGWARLVRGVFGRTPFAFPNVFLPTWQIEGLATYEESVIAGKGRVHAGDFGAIVSEAARARKIEPLDRVNGGLTDWPNGLAPYAYGAGFHAYLADRYGADTLAKLADQTAGRVPYTSSRVFERIYGKSLGTLWRDYQTQLTANATASANTDGATRLTHHGFAVSGPRFDRTACAGCAPQIVYSVATPHDFPSLNAIATDGSPPRRLATRYLGSTSAVGTDLIYFDQQELSRNTGRYSDLYALDRQTSRVRRLTSEARLLDPDLAPDGWTIACVQDFPGRRDLVIVRLPASARSALRPGLAGANGEGGKADATTQTTTQTTAGAPAQADVASAFRRTITIQTLVSEPETQFNAPRWSPDGQSIVVERHRPGAVSEIVVVDVTTSAVRVVASDARARLVTPAWLPDGGSIVAAVAPEDEPFNLREFPLDPRRPARQITRTTGGATWPDISPDGRSIVFVGYTTEGFDLFLMPYLTAAPAVPGPPAVPTPPASPALPTPPAPPALPAPPARAYHPWRTLKPTSWSPIVEVDSDQVRVGAYTAGTDVLRYHAYLASATWLVSSPAGAREPSRATMDWDLAYAYGRWQPTLWTAASNRTSFFAVPPTKSGLAQTGTLQELQIEVGVVLPVRHVRVSHAALVSVVRSTDQFTLPDRTMSLNRTALRGAWTVTSAHTYGYSISSERGVTLGVTAEAVRHALGSSGDADVWTADTRFYLPSIAQHHVIAIRAAAGTSTGSSSLQRTFFLGGAVPNFAAVDFGSDAISLLRGYTHDTFAGSSVALINTDYRWPLARPQRGFGTWPVFVDTLHAAVFADVGNAWTRSFHAHDIKTSVGAELSANLVAGYQFPFQATVGGAFGRDGSGVAPNGWTMYARVGRAF